ncbi:MAG: DUF169 domain-containing protein [Deltaproteobacteria bacterium]|nr:DUF169 domain-containing protein [Deltaproteobacteria bacterium]
MLKPGERFPERVKRPAQDLKIKVATCQAIAMARRYGWVVAVGDEDISCPLTAVVFGFRKASDFYMKGQACAGMYTETKEAGIRSEEQVAKFSFGEFKYILVAPLHRTTFEPEVMIIVPQRSGQCEVILPCLGDRVFAQTQDHEMAFSIPADRVEEIIEGLEGTQKGGVRYPIPSFLRYTGEFPEHYTKVVE